MALRSLPGFPDYPSGKPINSAGFDGRAGGLALYDHALVADEIDRLYLENLQKYLSAYWSSSSCHGTQETRTILNAPLEKEIFLI